MSDEKKSAYRQAVEALERTQKKIAGMRERGETIMGEGVRTAVGAVSSFAAGAVDQRFGDEDASTGIRVHKVNGAPSVLLAGLALKGSAALGLFGKFDVGGFAAGDGALFSGSSTWGRMAGERLRRKAEKVEAAQKKDKTPAADKSAKKAA